MTLKYLYVDGTSYPEDGQGTIKAMALGQHVSVDKQRAEHLRGLLRCLSVCHAVIPSLDEKTQKILYEGDSPDESALLDGVRTNDIEVTGRTNRDLMITFLGSKETFQLLYTLEFSSARKRMSVVVRTPEGQLVIFTKGADNIILERIKKGSLSEGQLAHLNETVENFSRVRQGSFIYL